MFMRQRMGSMFQWEIFEYKFWKNFCETVDRKDLIEEYASNIIEEKKENLRKEIQKFLKRRTEMNGLSFLKV